MINSAQILNRKITKCYRKLSKLMNQLDYVFENMGRNTSASIIWDCNIIEKELEKIPAKIEQLNIKFNQLMEDDYNMNTPELFHSMRNRIQAIWKNLESAQEYKMSIEQAAK